MSEVESLRRLGGGRWQSRDGRFTIEPQSGTWVVVDGAQADELGLPLVRGPFPSLTAARADIEAARTHGPARSPLAVRIETAAKRRQQTPKQAAHGKPTAVASTPPTAKTPQGRLPARPPLKAKEPSWLDGLEPARRRTARELIARLASQGFDDPEAIARAAVADDEPVLARLAIERRIRSAIESASDPVTAARAVTEVILGGQDRSLGAQWRLVDGEGRSIKSLVVALETP